MNGRVLIAEDDEDLGFCLAETLKDHNYFVHLATSGAEAMAWLDSGESVDLILSDYLMKNGDGLDLLRHVRARDSQKPSFIMMTGQGRMSAEEVLALGAQDFFTKPFYVPGLLQAIDKLVRHALD